MCVALAPALCASAQQQPAAEKTVTIKDAWGQEESVSGFNEVKQADGKWYVHDPSRPQPKAVEPGPSKTLGEKPPAGAVVLFDGTDLSNWTGGPWNVADGYMEVTAGKGEIRSKNAMGSGRLHLEFMTPSEPEKHGQDRGNSGVFLMGHYEIQVIDSYKAATYPDGMVGAVYGQTPPKVNASRPPGQWQTYDITFTAPKFDASGAVTSPARVTVLLNDVKVQDDTEILGDTGWRKRAAYTSHDTTGPLALQDHGHAVRYRNIWFVPKS